MLKGELEERCVLLVLDDVWEFEHALEPLTTVMSTAEAVAVGHAAGLQAHFCLSTLRSTLWVPR